MINYSLFFIKNNNLNRYAAEGPFRKSWELMKDTPESYWTSRDEAVNRIVDNPNLAVFDTESFLTASEAYKNKACHISHIPRR